MKKKCNLIILWKISAVVLMVIGGICLALAAFECQGQSEWIGSAYIGDSDIGEGYLEIDTSGSVFSRPYRLSKEGFKNFIKQAVKEVLDEREEEDGYPVYRYNAEKKMVEPEEYNKNDSITLEYTSPDINHDFTDERI